MAFTIARRSALLNVCSSLGVGTSMAALTLVAACTRNADGTDDVPLPALDQSTPQAALKSYWARLDWYGEQYVQGRAEPAAGAEQRLLDIMRPLITPGYLTSVRQRMPKGRHFLAHVGQVSIDGEGRASIEADISSDPPDATVLTPTPVELFEGESDGGHFRYRLVRSNGEWRIDELWRLDDRAAPRRVR